MTGPKKYHQSNSSPQIDMFAGLSPLQTQVIKRRKDFDSLFDGFSKMRAISYVISPDLLLDFFDKRGCSRRAG